MSASAIGSLTSLYPTPNIRGINAPIGIDKDGYNGIARVSGSVGGRHHGGGAFMQNVLQSLKNSGLNLPAANSGDANGQSASSTQASPSDAQQALHTFMHDLFQALNQTGAQQQTSSASKTDNDGDSGKSGSPIMGLQNRYSDFTTNLQGLISSLNNGSGNNSALQTDFTKLVNVLGSPSSTSSSSSTPSLQSFLQQLQANAGNNSAPQNSIGSILTLKA